MKHSKNVNILFFGLTLVFSLISFSGVINHLPIEATKTTLVVYDYSEDTRFSIQYNNVNKENLVSFSKYSNYYLISFQNHYDLKEITAFKTYSNKTLWLRAEQLHTKLYSFFTHKTRYNNIV